MMSQWPPSWKPPFKVIIGDGTEIDLEGRYSLVVYADGSRREGGVGAAAVSRCLVLRLYLGDEKEFTSHESELASITLALNVIKSCGRQPRTAVIVVDSLSVIQTLCCPRIRHGIHLFWISLFYTALAEVEKTIPNFELTLYWVHAHSGIWGNEWADLEAAKAAAGYSVHFRTCLVKSALPGIAAAKLLLSQSASASSSSPTKGGVKVSKGSSEPSKPSPL